MDLRELNYILIPRPGEAVERWEQGRLVRSLAPLLRVTGRLTPEGFVLLIATLLVGLAGVDVRFSAIYMLFCAMAGLLLAGWLARPLARSTGLRVSLRHPERVSAGQPLHLTVVLRNEGERSLWALRVLGPFLPWDGSWLSPPASIPRLDPGEERLVEVVLRLECRGERTLGRFRVGSVRPLGLFLGPPVRSELLRVVVVPPVAPLAPLPIPSELTYQPGGFLQASRAGESFELLGLRDYRPGDRPRDLHWRSWARLGRPVVREFRQEYYKRAAVLLHSQARGVPRTCFDAGAALAAGITQRLAQDEALVDLLLLSDPPREAVLGCHTRRFEEALDLLASVTPSRSAPRVDALTLLGPHLERLSAVYLLLYDWDAERAALVAELQARGLSLEVCAVAEGRRAERLRAAGLRVLSPAQVAGPQPLLLERRP